MNQFDIMDDPLHSIIYGPSTSNKIGWWHDPHERLERYFKEQLNTLLKGMECDPHNLTHRQLLAFVYVPIVQRECEVFVEYWNSHRIRSQENLEIPTGVPNHIFNFPEKYGGKNMGIPLAHDQLQDVAELSSVFGIDGNTTISQHLPNVDTVTCVNAIEAYRFLKSKILH